MIGVEESPELESGGRGKTSLFTTDNPEEAWRWVL